MTSGTKVLYATDEWFAPAHNLLKPGRGVFIPDKFTENGYVLCIVLFAAVQGLGLGIGLGLGLG